MALNDYTFQYRDLVFGKGLPVRVRSISGLDNFTVREGDKLIPRGDGAIPGDDFIDPKDIELTLQVIGTEAIVDQVLRTFNRRDVADPFHIKEPERPEVFVYARPLARMRILDSQSKFLHTIAIRLRAADPRIYGIEEYQRNVAIYNPTGGGLEFPIVNYAKEFTVPAGLEAIIANAGDSFAYPTIRVYGPVSGTVNGITILNVTNGDEITVDQPILNGQILTINMRAFVTANGERVIDLAGSNQFGAWVPPRVPFRLDPGENHIRFSVDGTSTNAQMLISWRDTSL